MPLISSSRLLWLPNWFWAVLPLALALVTYVLGPPGELPELPIVAAIFQEPIIVTRDGDSFRVLSKDEQEDIRPQWKIHRGVATLTSVDWKLGWDGDGPHLGFYKTTASRTYGLSAQRSDQSLSDSPEPFLPAAEVEQLRPLIIKELDRRSPDTRLGTQLEELLQKTQMQESYVCLQNSFVLATWLSIPVALFAIFRLIRQLQHWDEEKEAQAS
jgi:hypothetical protein